MTKLKNSNRTFRVISNILTKFGSEKIVKLKWEFVVSKGSIGAKVPEKFLISVFSVSSQGNAVAGKSLEQIIQAWYKQFEVTDATFLAALSNS